MARDNLDGQIEGQMTIADLYDPPEKLFAVARIFSRARKDMSLAEQKTFVYALSEIKFTEEAKTNYVYLDKNVLANILGVDADPDHLSENIFRMIKDLPVHTFFEDLQSFASGTIITTVKGFKKNFRLRFNEDFLPLFTNLTTDYITMWSSDIFQMTSKRSVQFYEYLRQVTDTRETVNNIGLGVKALKEMFQIPKDGKGSYTRADGHFNRPEFEKRVIEPLCEDLKNCRMIQLVVQKDGKYYEKVKRGNRVDGYRFYWTFTSRPAIATASEVKEIQDRVDQDPVILKIMKDKVNGQEKQKKAAVTPFNDFQQRDYDYDAITEKLRSKK